ncbi:MULTISPECIES: NAD(P)-binding protein [Rhizobium/Agrobacterium group]|uniref:NAD(P)-binding protein n=1 Tax=Rhizobium/Agrobacterium group TaxID=227290 RepID=UPI0022B60332|nr:NAD(P)-binding protein [Rhizobium rhizogenes]MCZ7472706.1 NAD(P)-binding protein [Rhizobium rhizogenes]MCZ7484032.1 NAD(P)-binding protein [Rhizobium rhizogenes]
MSQDLPILIAGGGIGGLATAIGLANRGFHSVVLEKSPVLGEIGAGIQLGPNAFHAFEARCGRDRPQDGRLYRQPPFYGRHDGRRGGAHPLG